MKKVLLAFIMLLFPLLFLSQRIIPYYLNKNIDFVLDNDSGRKFLGNIVTEHFKTDSTNHFYNQTGILPFYRYTESDFFDKIFLQAKVSIIDDRESSFKSTIESEHYKEGIDYEFNLNVCRGCSMDIQSSVIKGSKPNEYFGASQYRFKNFCLSSSIDNRKSREQVRKEYYSNVTVTQQGGMNIFDEGNKEGNKELVFYNTLSINYTNNVKNINFLVKIYDTTWCHDGGRLVKKDLRYLDRYMDLLMRKVEITGNKEEAIKYLKKNKLDYDEIEPENYKEEFFIKR